MHTNFMIQVTCVNKSGGYHENPHTAISYLGWVNDQTGARGITSRLDMYEFVRQGNKVYVSDGRGNIAYLTTAVTALGTKYVKTLPDGTRSDNLLQLLECVG